MKHYLGIDLGGTAIAAGVVREDYTLIKRHSTPTGHPRPLADIVRDMALTARHALEDAGLSESDVDYIGIGAPSSINQQGQRVVYANNLDWRDADIVSVFQKTWDIPLYLANDADVALVAEAKAGAARGYDNVAMFTLGTGVGGGLLFGGKLFTGGDGFGTEPGHTVLVMDGEPCTCGQKGCFEAYGSVTALIRDTIRAIADNPQSLMREMIGGDISRVSGRTAFQAAKQGDAAGKQVVERYIHYLAVGIASVIDLLRPQAVVIGGGISNEGENLFGPLREQVKPLVYAGDIIGVPPIVKAEMGNDAGIIGAALLGV